MEWSYVGVCGGEVWVKVFGEEGEEEGGGGRGGGRGRGEGVQCPCVVCVSVGDHR